METKRQLGGCGLVVLMNRVLVKYGEGLDSLWRSEVDRTDLECYCSTKAGEFRVNARITATWQGAASLYTVSGSPRLQPTTKISEFPKACCLRAPSIWYPYALGNM